MFFILTTVFAAGCSKPSKPVGETIIVLDRGYVGPANLQVWVDEALSDAVKRGSTTEVWMISNGSASTMTRVALPNQGEFKTTAQNGPARALERDEMKAKASEALMTALTNTSSAEASLTGTDLLGGLEAGIGRLTDLSAPSTLYLITGGGVHATAQFDLYKDDLEAMPVWKPTFTGNGQKDFLTIKLLGVGLFPGVSSIDNLLVGKVVKFWSDRCANLQPLVQQTCNVGG
jgi:hypothetical protein